MVQWLSSPSRAPSTALAVRPRIGISGLKDDSKSIAAAVAQVRALGGDPVFLRPDDPKNAAAVMAELDGLMVMGNNYDLDPATYGQTPDPATKSEAAIPDSDPDKTLAQQRAAFETELLKLALEKNTPLLTVCGGTQRLNVLLGGTLHQDIVGLLGKERGEAHNQAAQNIAPFTPVESIAIQPGSTLDAVADGIGHVMVPQPDGGARAIKGEMENSFHHQAIDAVGNGLRANAFYTADGYTDPKTGAARHLIGGIEVDPNGPLAAHPFLLGVQWHPEFGASALAPKIIGSFVEAAQQHALAQGKEARPHWLDAILNPAPKAAGAQLQR